MLTTLIAVMVCVFASNNATAEKSNLRLWYQQPANEWVEALPVGNGRLGAMV
ncbi:glycoside hydrolase family 95 protein, partial [bacterium]|nr:glycoside hydrolase family 95 protein [bacterium]